MNLLNITYDFNHTAFQKDAVLLSMLPYCMISYSALNILFNGRSERWGCISNLRRQRLVELKTIHIPSAFRGFDYKYLTITLDGLNYVASNYSALYPWLSYLHDSDLDLVRTRARANTMTMYGLLLRQSISLFWAMAGAETIYERMGTQPRSVADSLFYLSNSDLWTPYSLAYLMKEHPTRTTHLIDPSTCTFYDSMEARSLLATTSANEGLGNSERPQKDQSVFKANHTGLLIDSSNQKYMAFATMKHGIHWSSNPIVKNRTQLRAQFNAIRPGISTDIPHSGFHAFLICGTHHEMRHSFTNKRRQWAKRTRYLGQGTASLHLLPYNDNGIALAQNILNTNHYNTNLSYQLSQSNPDVSYNGLDLHTPLSYKGEGCVPCFDMDAIMLQYAKEQLESSGKTNIICWDWEVPYISEMLPEATVYAVSSTTGEVDTAEAAVAWEPEEE